MLNTNKGFTLAEVLAVVVILAILAIAVYGRMGEAYISLGKAAKVEKVLRDMEAVSQAALARRDTEALGNPSWLASSYSVPNLESDGYLREEPELPMEFCHASPCEIEIGTGGYNYEGTGADDVIVFADYANEDLCKGVHEKNGLAWPPGAFVNDKAKAQCLVYDTAYKLFKFTWAL